MESLPDEILYQIFSHFEAYLPDDQFWLYGSHIDHTPTKTLLSIALVCQRFNHVAKPLIYRTALIEGRDEESIRYTLLARSLLASPALGHNTRAISIIDSHLTFYRYEQIRKDLLDLLPSLDIPLILRKVLEHRFKNDVDTTELAGTSIVPLLLLPNLRLVDITWHEQSQTLLWALSGRSDLLLQLAKTFGERINEYEDDYHMEWMQDTAEKSGLDRIQDTNGFIQNPSKKDEVPETYKNFGLQNLGEIRLRTGDCTHGVTCIDSIEPVLLHPNLKTLQLHGISWLHECVSRFKLPKESIQIQHLTLRDSMVDHSSIRNILSRFKNLQTLSVHLAICRRYSESDDWDVDLDEIGDVLRELGGNLVSFDFYTSGYEEMSLLEGELGSLIQMKSLKHLKIIIQNFIVKFGSYEEDPEKKSLNLADHLPPFLETLHLYWDEHYFSENFYKRKCILVNEVITEMLMSGKIPSLRQVTIERFYDEKLIGEFHRNVPGWNVTVGNQHLWQTYSGSGCLRTIVCLTKNA